jgi:hypothetical protein
VLHDWEDSKAQAILQNLHAAASQDSRLVVIEEIVPFTCAAENLSADVKELKIGYDLPSVLYGNPGLANRTPFDTDISVRINLSTPCVPLMFGCDEDAESLQLSRTYYRAVERSTEEFRVEHHSCAGGASIFDYQRTHLTDWGLRASFCKFEIKRTLWL